MKKRKRKKHHRLSIPGLIVLALFVLVILAFLWRSEAPTGRKIEMTSVTEIDGQISFTMKNVYEQPAECYIIISGDDDYERNLGIIPAKGSRFIVEQTSPEATYNVECEWREMDITGCEETTFFLCELTRINPKLSQCLPNDIPYQHFCAALISRNSSICDGIRIEPRKTHCKAYMENNPDLCETLQTGRDWCYEDFAMNKGRADLCEKIEDPARSKSCEAVITGNIEICKSLPDNTGCILHFADRMRNMSLCDYASDKADCYKELDYLE